MREPERYRMEIDVNWGAAILILPLALLTPEVFGTAFAAAAAILLFSALTGIIRLW
jgi:hypothetical protein